MPLAMPVALVVDGLYMKAVTRHTWYAFLLLATNVLYLCRKECNLKFYGCNIYNIGKNGFRGTAVPKSIRHSTPSSSTILEMMILTDCRRGLYLSRDLASCLHCIRKHRPGLEATIVPATTSDKEEDEELLKDGEAEMTRHLRVIHDEMRPYQPLNWMMTLHHNGLNGMLADDIHTVDDLQALSRHLRPFSCCPEIQFTKLGSRVQTVDSWFQGRFVDR